MWERLTAESEGETGLTAKLGEWVGEQLARRGTKAQAGTGREGGAGQALGAWSRGTVL